MALVHRCRFFEWVPERVVGLSASASEALAVGRLNGDINIYYPFKDNYYSGKKITGQSNQCMRCLTWGKGESAHRLFSGVDAGFIYEWNLTTLQQEQSTDSYGGWVTSLSVNKAGTKLAAGTTGGVTVFDLREGGLSFITKLIVKKNQVTAVEFHPKDDIIYAISQKEVCKFEPRGERRYEQTATYRLDSFATSLLVLPDSTIVVGTSKGGVSFWNGKLNVQIGKFHEHQTLINALATNAAGDTIYASGGDPKICVFKKAGPGFSKWIYSGHQRRHTHDVSSIVVMQDRVISGSFDTTVIVQNASSFNPQATSHIASQLLPFPHSTPFDIAKSKGARLVLYQKQDGLEVWRLGSTVDGATKYYDIPVRTPPIKLLYMELNKDNNYLHASAISPNGKYIACATAKSVKLFKLNYDQDDVTVTQLEIPSDLLLPHRLTLTDTALVLASHTHLQFLTLPSLTPSSEYFLARDDDDYSPAPINTMATSHDGAFVAIGDMNNNIHVFDVSEQSHLCALPKMKDQHTALCFQPTATVLSFVDVTGKVHMYDFKRKAFTPWSQTHQELPQAYLACVSKSPITGIAFDPEHPSNAVLWSPEFIASLKFTDQDGQRPAKRARPENGSAFNPATIYSKMGGENACVKMMEQFGDVMGAGFVEEGIQGHEVGLVVVERPWMEVVPHLPNAFNIKRFGR